MQIIALEVINERLVLIEMLKKVNMFNLSISQARNAFILNYLGNIRKNESIKFRVFEFKTTT